MIKLAFAVKKLSVAHTLDKPWSSVYKLSNQVISPIDVISISQRVLYSHLEKYSQVLNLDLSQPLKREKKRKLPHLWMYTLKKC